MIITIDTAGEFPTAVNWPEYGQDEARWKGESAVPDAPAEFASSITIGDSHSPASAPPAPAAARTIAAIPAWTLAGSDGQASITAARSAGIRSAHCLCAKRVLGVKGPRGQTD